MATIVSVQAAWAAAEPKVITARRGWQVLLRGLHWLEDATLVSLLATMILMSCVQIALRNFFATGLVWNESMLRILVLWLTLVGAMVASRQGYHIAINLGRQLVPPRWASATGALVNFIAALLCCICAYYTALFVWGEYQYPYAAFANVPSWVTALIIPLGFAVMAARFLIQTFIPVSPPTDPAPPPPQHKEAPG